MSALSAVLLSYQPKGAYEMNRLEALLSSLDYSLDTKKKRHMVGGILMSISMLFGGLAVTVITLKTEEQVDEKFIE